MCCQMESVDVNDPTRRRVAVPWTPRLRQGKVQFVAFGRSSASGCMYMRFFIACDETSCSELADTALSRPAFACMKTTRWGGRGDEVGDLSAHVRADQQVRRRQGVYQRLRSDALCFAGESALINPNTLRASQSSSTISSPFSPTTVLSSSTGTRTSSRRNPPRRRSGTTGL